MPERNFRPAALAISRILLRLCGWDPVYNTAIDLWTVAKTLAGPTRPKPSPKEIERIVNWARASLSEIFRVEFNYIADNDINAAVLTIADLLNEQPFNALLLQAVTDSSALEGHLLVNGGAKMRRDLLSEDAISAFDVLLRNCCQHLAEITLSAPEFGPLALQQLLRGQDKLEIIAEHILQSLTAFVNSGALEEDFAEFTSRYMNKVSEQLDFLDIPGIDLERHRQRYSLTTAYIPIDTDYQEANQFEFGSLESLLRLSHFLLITGEPGSGKTTLLKWAAVQAARTQNGVYRQRIVPFLIKLRSLPDVLPDINDIGSPFTEGLVIPKPINWSRQLIASGRAVLLFDGLDEVPEHRRETIVKWIEQIHNDYGRGDTYIIVTSRIAAIRETRFRPRFALTATLQPMSQGKLERYIRLWHRAVYDGVVSGSSEWPAVSDQLLARLENDIHLSRLASNPLLCAVICALYHARSQHLPSERSELYEALLAMLLARRDYERKGIEAFLGLTDAQRLAEEIALSFLERQREELSRDDVVDILRNSLRSFSSTVVRDTRPTLVLDHFVSRTGVLRELPGGVVDFWHKSFQEFLAARMLLAQGRDRELLAHCSDAAWREVVIWACSLMEMARASKLIIGILDAADHTSTISDRDYIFGVALSCSHYALQLNDHARRRLSECTSALTSPIISFDPSVILEFGPAAVPVLENLLVDLETDRYHNPIIAKLINALARIGGEAANTALSQTTSEFKCRWASELGKCWSFSGSADYARRVLGEVPFATGDDLVPINVESFRQLRGIDQISAIYRVKVKIQLTDLDPESLGDGSARPIFCVELLDAKWKDALAFLARYPAVGEVNLVLSSDCMDLGDNVSVIHAVRHLRIEAKSGIRLDLAALRIFPRLGSLEIHGPIQILSANGFSNNRILKDVFIDLYPRWGYREMSNAVTVGLDKGFIWSGALERLKYRNWGEPDISRLCKLERLRELDLSGSGVLETLQGIDDLPRLTSLNVSGCTSLRDIGYAFLHPRLSTIDIDGCDTVSAEDLFALFVEMPFGTADINKYGPDSNGFELVGSPWRDALMTLSDKEISLRRWDDWSLWDEIRGDADEWETHDPGRADEYSAAAKGISIYNSFEDWLRLGDANP